LVKVFFFPDGDGEARNAQFFQLLGTAANLSVAAFNVRNRESRACLALIFNLETIVLLTLLLLLL
jgi:hypothetical protein